MGVRLPTILGKAIDDVWRTLNEQSEEHLILDLLECIERMDVLMTDLSQNNKLRFIIGTCSPQFCDSETDLWGQMMARVIFLFGTRRLPSSSREKTL